MSQIWYREPVFVFTTDIDWASEPCIVDLLDIARAYGVHTTAFVTHSSGELMRRAAANEIELGIHPNFLSNSSHGSQVDEIIDHVLSFAPGARCFRSHAMVDSSPISVAMSERGILYDSNLALYLQAGLVPLNHWTGMLRFPIFWADDVHWRRNGVWELNPYKDDFFSPGIKILSVHPFFFTMNIPDHPFYLAHKPRIPTLSAEEAKTLRFVGKGTRTLLVEIFEAVQARGLHFYRLDELYRIYTGRQAA